MRYCALCVSVAPATSHTAPAVEQAGSPGSPLQAGSPRRQVCDCFSLQQVFSREQQRTETRAPLQTSSSSQPEPCAGQQGWR